MPRNRNEIEREIAQALNASGPRQTLVIKIDVSRLSDEQRDDLHSAIVAQVEDVDATVEYIGIDQIA